MYCQLGRRRSLEERGRRFESCHPDQLCAGGGIGRHSGLRNRNLRVRVSPRVPKMQRTPSRGWRVTPAAGAALAYRGGDSAPRRMRIGVGYPAPSPSGKPDRRTNGKSRGYRVCSPQSCWCGSANCTRVTFPNRLVAYPCRILVIGRGSHTNSLHKRKHRRLIYPA